MKHIILVIVAAVQFCFIIDLVKGHGMILDPAGRGSRWRFDSSARPNFDDMSNFCGGFYPMFYHHNGKCGLCGDNFGDAKPRAHELGGTYGGTGVIVKTYSKGSQVEFKCRITASHLGYVYYEICNLDEFGTESEECFKKYRLQHANGTDTQDIDPVGDYNTLVVLPNDLSCNHCVVRWTYIAGNNWGWCDDGTGRLGCGNQETFKTCADIRITS